MNCDKTTSKKEWKKFISFFNSYSRIFICACSVIIEYVNKKQIKYLEQKLTKQSEYATSVYSPLFFRGGGGTIPLVWIWKPIVSHTVEEAMSLLVSSYCICACLHHCPSLKSFLCCLSPFHLSYVAVSRPCRLSEYYCTLAGPHSGKVTTVEPRYN